MEWGETIEHCAVRETLEECGLALKSVRQGPCVNVADMSNSYHYVVVFAIGEADKEAAINREPCKCEGWDWYPWADLPGPLFHPLKLLQESGYSPFHGTP